MPDPSKLFVMTRLREARGITLSEMAQSCGLHGSRGRETVGQWERGQCVPRDVRRGAIFAYLWNDLDLQSSPDQFRSVVGILCEEWGWEPPSRQEWDMLRARSEQGRQHHLQSPAPHFDARLPVLAAPAVVGIDTPLSVILGWLHDPAVRVICLEGIGGIGKTTLANLAVRRYLAQNPEIDDVYWVSARLEYLTESGIRAVPGVLTGGLANLSLECVITEIARQMEIQLPAGSDSRTWLRRIAEAASGCRLLIVIDNLESMEDFRAVGAVLEQIPARFLLTCRHSLPGMSHSQVYRMEELSQQASCELVEETARRRRIHPGPPERVYQLTGGNPLAILLVVSLMRVLPAEQVLEDVRIGSADALYRYIYWKAWQELSEPARKVLFAIHRVGGETSWEWLKRSMPVPVNELESVIYLLADLSLVDSLQMPSGCRFRIHRLTSTFLQTEVLGWK